MIDKLKVDLSGAEWRKSVNSGDGECVEVAMTRDAVGVRDSKNATGSVLVFTHGEWSAFLAGVKGGEFEI